MGYQVLARKWRPRQFTELVGQEHVVRALTNGLDNDRLHHAFLFTGTRGVGKTTIARILAKSLNCDTGVSASPCGQCATCQEIDQGRFVDLIEVDAASRTKVDDTRELLDNVQYAPTRGRYKVYLIDEVHMLSNSSFNALLKTLEEPPQHVKFLFATTDPQKLPVTVLSRCLQFNLRQLTPEQIHAQLTHVLTQEGIASEPKAVHELALAADGSMRDGLSLLDQAIAFGNGEVRFDDVVSMLGTIDRHKVLTVLEHALGHDMRSALGAVEALASMSPDYDYLLRVMLETLHWVALSQSVPEAVPAHMDVDRIQSMAAHTSPEDVQLAYQIMLHARRDLPFSATERGGFEMAIIRLAEFTLGSNEASSDADGSARPAPRPVARAAPATADAGKQMVSADVAPAAPMAEPTPTPTHTAQPQAAPTQAAPAPPASPQPAVLDAGVLETPDWGVISKQLRLLGLARELANNCTLIKADAQTWVLGLARTHEHIRTEGSVKALREALQSAGVDRQVRVEIEEAVSDTPAQRAEAARHARQVAAEQSIANDDRVDALRNMFDAEVQEGSVRPLDSQ